MKPADLRALLEKASPTPWGEHFKTEKGKQLNIIAIGDPDGYTVGQAHSVPNGEAIIALVNLAPLLIELWQQCRQNRSALSCDYGILAALDELEDA